MLACALIGRGAAADCEQQAVAVREQVALLPDSQPKAYLLLGLQLVAREIDEGDEEECLDLLDHVNRSLIRARIAAQASQPHP